MTLMAFLLLVPIARADEGMWFLMFIERLNQRDMQKLGLQLTAQEIYSINNNSLKDAIVQFNGGCTASIISKDELVLTNHQYFFRISDEIRLSYDLSDYLSIFLQVVFGMAIIFLFPMIVYVLTSLGILTPQLMKTYRRHAIVIIMIIAAIITPADVVSMFIAAIPLLLLYEMSVAMAQIIYKRLLKEQDLD